jgi:hypothetical protein
MTMRRCWLVFAVALVFHVTSSAAGPSHGNRLLEQVQDIDQNPTTTAARRPSAPSVIPVANETNRPEPDTDVFALMSGSCSTLRIAGRNFTCRSVAYFHSSQGRAEFTIALDDPNDDSHIISFSGQNGQRADDNKYELPVDRMLLNSKDRPKVDGLPVPFAELSTGMCKQFGNFAARQVSSISCAAMDRHGKRYELQFVSDGLPITLRRVRQSEPTLWQHPFE